MRESSQEKRSISHKRVWVRQSIRSICAIKRRIPKLQPHEKKKLPFGWRGKGGLSSLPAGEAKEKWRNKTHFDNLHSGSLV
mmetsp:Transcript_19627/g.31159  ORF Transcript_19627/g.31159 Transcript_19627/m.31159 type:complete len:81 (-) Transcript_19627:1209-1451(-)